MIANIERSANLFVTKTVYAVLLAITVSVISWPYPFLPRHLTIVSVVHDRHPRLLPRAGAEHAALRPRLHRAGAAVLHPGRPRRRHGRARRLRHRAATATTSPTREVRTTSALVLIAVALWVLVIQARPFNWWKTCSSRRWSARSRSSWSVPAFRDFYAVELPPAEVLGEAAIVAGVAIVLLEVGWRFSRVIGSRRNPHEVVDDDPADEEGDEPDA